MISPDRTAVPSPLRRPAGWLAAGAAVAVALLGLRYAGLSGSSRADEVLWWAVETWIPEKERGFFLIQTLGNPKVVVVLAGLLAGIALLAGRRRLALLALLGPGLTGAATTLLKPLFDRTLGGELAYPSGHTAGLTALAIVAALLLVSLLRPTMTATVLLVAAAALGAGFVMAVALTALDFHYPTDTIGGFGTAVAVVLTAALVLDRLAEARGRLR